ncbi:glycosyltransferase family 2 protein [Algoriphagus kandeliae]|uniref:Glycosyltransferase family 2 protein n=1 Tax=Algoriphagus kandeliae TaxID=2562278 RepID=A0A4Y9QYT3_9BACT|nr:glycosyltransferase family A protein [Algoriphagus kandeliae]TFV97200.1 glycosyltransferase family 2 protein [Algoriphagus kandeliae]
MFSIICPVHNKEKELKETLDSVFAQEFQDFQLVLIENASIDNSLEVIQSYMDERIHLIQAGKIGPGAARNLGVKAAKYPWIAFLDADDVWEKYHLQNLKKAIDSNPNKYFFSTAWEIWSSEEKRQAPIQAVFGKSEGFIPLSEVLNLNLLNSPPFWTSAIAVSKEAFDSVEGFPESLPAHGEDVSLWAKLLDKQQGIYFINKPSAKYRIDSESMTSKSFFSGQVYQVSFPGHIFSAVKKIIEEVKDPTLELLWKKFANKYQFSAFSKALIAGTFQKEDVQFLYPETDLKSRSVQILLRNSLLRGIFKSYLIKNQRFHG